MLVKIDLVFIFWNLCIINPSELIFSTKLLDLWLTWFDSCLYQKFLTISEILLNFPSTLTSLSSRKKKLAQTRINPVSNFHDKFVYFYRGGADNKWHQRMKVGQPGAPLAQKGQLKKARQICAGIFKWGNNHNQREHISSSPPTLKTGTNNNNKWEQIYISSAGQLWDPHPQPQQSSQHQQKEQLPSSVCADCGSEIKRE